MPATFQRILDAYLVPFALALLVWRRYDHAALPRANQPERRPTSRVPIAAHTAIAILIADDSAVVRAKLRRLLESSGYAV